MIRRLRPRAGRPIAEGSAAVIHVRPVVVLDHLGRRTHVRALQTGEEFLVQAPRSPSHIVPGQVATLVLERSSRRGRTAAGELRGLRVDVVALRLPKLRLYERRALAASGATYEMEQVLPKVAHWEDPIFASIARRERGDIAGAADMLVSMLRRDLRCIDAHAHLGNLAFRRCAEHARAHYEVGVAFGDKALGPDFRGGLPWAYLDNRPYLRCLHGLGLSLWRLGRMDEAVRVLERLLRLNPPDEQGARRCLREIEAAR